MMRNLVIAALVAALLVMPGGLMARAAGTKGGGKGGENPKSVADVVARSSFLDLKCTVPWMSADVAPLRRSWVPNQGDLIQHFFGGQQGVTATQEVRSPIYGRGTRFKSGKVIYLTPDGMDPRQSAQQATKAEYVAAFLDLYSSGFSYQNNVPHTPVHATNVQVTGVHSADVSHHDVYTVEDGRATAAKLISDMFGPLSVPAGFQTSVNTMIQDFGEKLFIYRVTPEYITNVYVRGAQGQEQKIKSGLPLFETFVNIQLDGDKLLAGMEYYWDNNLSVVGTPKKSIDAYEAVEAARQGLFKYYGEAPPLMSVTNLKLGYIVDRKNPSQLIPAWLFDASYTQTVTEPDKTGLRNGLTSSDLEIVPRPFAVNALSGDLLPLWQ
jgi:hypothetical protein